MRFTERARTAYAATLRSSGEALFGGGRVHLEGVDGRGWEASVEIGEGAGAGRLAVCLRPTAQGIRGSCGCGADGEPCAHQWAVLRELETLAAAVDELGRDAPCFHRHPITGRVVGWSDPSARAEVLEASARRRAPRPEAQATAVSERAQPAWARRIGRWRSSEEGRAPERQRAVWLVDVRQSRERDALALLPVHFGDGPPCAAGRDPTSAHPADRPLLACLRGADEPSALTREGGPPRAFVAGADLVATLLPLARQAGLYLWDNRSDAGTLPRQLPAAIAWDDGPAFRFAARQAASGGRTRVCGELWRSADAIADGDTLALLGPGHALVQRGGEPTIVRVDCGRGTVLARSLLVDGPLDAPADAATDVLDRLVEIPGADRIESDLVEWVALSPVPTLSLIEPEGNGDSDVLAGELRFAYGAGEIAADAPGTCVDLDAGSGATGRRRLARRVFDEEALLRRAFLDAGGLRLDSGVPAIPTDTAAEVVQRLLDAGFRVRTGRADVLAAGAPRLRARCRDDRVDWFELEGAVPFGAYEVALPELLVARPERPFVRLDENTVGLVPQEFSQRLRAVSTCAADAEAPLRFRANQTWVLDALWATRPDAALEFDERLGAARARLQKGLAPEPTPAPEGFGATLRDYQREGLGWLRFVADLGLGACLADDMGLGKTVQVLARLEQRRRERDRKAGPSLVVAPRSLVGNWHREAARFAPAMRTLSFVGARRWTQLGEAETSGLLGYDLVLTTYGTLRQDVARLRDVAWDYVVLDEAQAIKNARSQASKAVRLLSSEHRLALSGTPVENHLGELWSLFEFLNPGMLGRNRAFVELFEEAQGEARDDALVQLQRTLQPLMLRRTKESVLHELPPKSEQVLHCPMGPNQERLYGQLAAYYRESLLAEGRAGDAAPADRIQVLEGLLRLRQAACHPGLLDPARAADDCAKFEVLRPMLDEIRAGGHKALVFSQFNSFLKLLAAQLERDGVPFAYLDGATADRESCVDRFQGDADCGVFLISLRAGNAGLNLTAADYVFLLDPWWNPAAEAQAIDRAHRMGQTRPVMAYRLICPGTVEEHVAALQARKRELAASVLAPGGTTLRDLSADDLARLLGEP